MVDQKEEAKKKVHRNYAYNDADTFDYMQRLH